MLSKEELMMPRYKVIASYPLSDFELGTIIKKVKHQWIDNGWAIRVSDVIDWENYPHLFKRLEWWEERKPEDMPEYFSYFSIGRQKRIVIKVNKWDYNSEGNIVTSKGAQLSWFGNKTQPSNEEEYLTQQNSNHATTRTDTAQ